MWVVTCDSCRWYFYFALVGCFRYIRNARWGLTYYNLNCSWGRRCPYLTIIACNVLWGVWYLVSYLFTCEVYCWMWVVTCDSCRWYFDGVRNNFISYFHIFCRVIIICYSNINIVKTYCFWRCCPCFKFRRFFVINFYCS